MSRYIPANAEPRALYLVEIAARPTLPGWPCGETLNKGDAPLLSRRRPPLAAGLIPVALSPYLLIFACAKIIF